MDSDSPTLDYPAAPAAPVAAPARAPDGDLRALLRRRLIVLVGLAVWGLASYVAGRLPDLRGIWADDARRGLFALSCAVLAATAGILLALVVRRSWGVQSLRAAEVAALAVVAGQAVAQTLDPVPAILLSPEATTYGATGDILLWFVVITLYGVLIPNTLRRAALATGALTAVAAGSMLLAWSRYELPDAARMAWVANLVAFLGVAAAASVFNSARLDSYRRAAEEARELGQYRVGRRLGGGGMGEVFLAEHRHLKRPCAVKLLRADRASDETFVRRFEREVAAATRLTHPSAVQVYDYGRAADGSFYYAMEYLPGLTLEEVVARTGPMPPGRAVGVLRQLCGALGEAHSLGLTHRDIKPANVMLCRLAHRADAAKLLDFGLVFEAGAAEARLTAAGGLLGTPAYLSPEQARGGEVGPAGDLYSLGGLAYFLLTGRPPFGSLSALQAIHAHLTAAPEPPSRHNPAVPRDLEAVVLRLLAKSPAGRPSGAAGAEAELAACACTRDWGEADAAAWWGALDTDAGRSAAEAPTRAG